MKPCHDCNLTVRAVAGHSGLSPRTVRDRLTSGDPAGIRIGGEWWDAWSEVRAADKKPAPGGSPATTYREPLVSKKDVAENGAISGRTVARRITDGLPTRNVFGSTRIAHINADDWVRRVFGAAGTTSS